MFLNEQVIERAINAGWKPPWHHDTRAARVKFGPKFGDQGFQRGQAYWLSPDGSRLEPLPEKFYEPAKTEA